LKVTERSAQSLISCGSQTAITDDQCKKAAGPFTYGCDGGNGGSTLQYIAVYGLNSEQAYPRTAGSSTATSDLIEHGSYTKNYNPLGEYSAQCNSPMAVTHTTEDAIGSLNIYSMGKVSSDEQIMNEIRHEGPLYLAFQAYENLFSHTNGVHVPDVKASKYQGLHSVVAYGWGEEEGTGERYWLLQNSWGESWGDGGRFKMIRGTKGLLRGGYFASVDPAATDTTDFSFAKGKWPECFLEAKVAKVGDSCFLQGTNTCPGPLRLWLGSMSCDSFGQLAKGPVDMMMGEASDCSTLPYKLSSNQMLPGYTGPPIAQDTSDAAAAPAAVVADTTTGVGSGSGSGSGAGSGSSVGAEAVADTATASDNGSGSGSGSGSSAADASINIKALPEEPGTRATK
jgi:hypothetical protein